MKKFGFDKSIYKILNESLFDDTDDILSTEDNTNNISDLYIDDEYLLEKFNELYSKLDLSKYNLIEYPVFSKITTYNINGIDYKFITECSKDEKYAAGSPTGIKYSGCMTYIINSQKLINFMETYNIIIQYPVECQHGHESYITYVIDNITIPHNFFNNFYLYLNPNVKQKSYFISLILNKCNIIENELEKLLSENKVYIHLKYILLNKLNIKTLELSNVTYGYPLEITNCNLLTDIKINYNINNYIEASLLIKNNKLLTNLEINDNSKYISLLKLKIDKCPNINTDTLILPNHNINYRNALLLNDKSLLRSIKYRGDIVKYFYTELHPDYKYKYYQISPNKNMYWLK